MGTSRPATRGVRARAAAGPAGFHAPRAASATRAAARLTLAQPPQFAQQLLDGGLLLLHPGPQLLAVPGVARDRQPHGGGRGLPAAAIGLRDTQKQSRGAAVARGGGLTSAGRNGRVGRPTPRRPGACGRGLRGGARPSSPAATARRGRRRAVMCGTAGAGARYAAAIDEQRRARIAPYLAACRPPAARRGAPAVVARGLAGRVCVWAALLGRAGEGARGIGGILPRRPINPRQWRCHGQATTRWDVPPRLVHANSK